MAGIESIKSNIGIRDDGGPAKAHHIKITKISQETSVNSPRGARRGSIRFTFHNDFQALEWRLFAATNALKIVNLPFN